MNFIEKSYLLIKFAVQNEMKMEDFVSINVNTGRSRTNSLINRKMIFRILGILLFMEAAMFLVCASVSWYYREKEYIYFIYSILINVGVGEYFCCWAVMHRIW